MGDGIGIGRLRSGYWSKLIRGNGAVHVVQDVRHGVNEVQDYED